MAGCLSDGQQLLVRAFLLSRIFLKSFEQEWPAIPGVKSAQGQRRQMPTSEWPGACLKLNPAKSLNNIINDKIESISIK